MIKPPLTVIEQPVEQMGRAAGELIMKRIQRDFRDFPQRIELKTKMLPRQSVQQLEHP